MAEIAKVPETDQRLARILDVARRDLDEIEKVWKYVQEHQRRGRYAPSKVRKTNKRGEDISHITAPISYGDETGEAVVNARRAPEAADRHATSQVLDVLNRLSAAREELVNRLPAIAAALEGRELSDHETQVDASACMVCSNIVVRLKRGMCETDYKAWVRAGRPDVMRWSQERRSYLAEKESTR